jgi:hypothetical protein
MGDKMTKSKQDIIIAAAIAASVLGWIGAVSMGWME